MTALKRMAMVAAILATAAATTTATNTPTTATTAHARDRGSRATPSSSDAGRASSSSPSSPSATFLRRRSMTRGLSNDGDENDVGVEDYGRYPSDRGARPSPRLARERANGDVDQTPPPTSPPLQSSAASGSENETMRPMMVKGTAAAEQRELTHPRVIPMRGPRYYNENRPSNFVNYSEKRAKTEKKGGGIGGRVGGGKRLFHEGNRMKNLWMRYRHSGKSSKSSKKHGGWYYVECYDPSYDDYDP
jgi:hypothetical protein